MKEAVDLAVAVRADLDDPQQVTALTTRCEADTRALVADVCRRRGGDEAWQAFTAQEVAEQIRDERRTSAHHRLMAAEEAQAEADAVYAAALRRSPRHQHAARDEAEQARARTADYLLRHQLGQLQTARAAASRVQRRAG